MSGGDRSRADEALALELAAGRTVQDAARSVGVSEQTVYRRLREKRFRDRVCALRSQLLDAAAGRLADLSRYATGVLTQGMAQGPTPIGVRSAIAV